jgi:hypothetical protein
MAHGWLRQFTPDDPEFLATLERIGNYASEAGRYLHGAVPDVAWRRAGSSEDPLQRKVAPDSANTLFRRNNPSLAATICLGTHF